MWKFTGIRPQLRMILDSTGVALQSAGRRLYMTPHERDPFLLTPWVITKGDQTLRLYYKLTPQSVVVDVGGYEGRWTADIVKKFDCTVHVFEPVKEFAANIKQRFQNNPKVHVYAVGLGGRDRDESISLNQDESSTIRPVGQAQQVTIVNTVRFFRDHNIERIDLIKMNIEAGEYELLEHLIATDYVKKCRNIQVQFHNFFPEAKERMQKIQTALAATHELTFQFPFTWENWKLKEQ